MRAPTRTQRSRPVRLPPAARAVAAALALAAPAALAEDAAPVPVSVVAPVPVERASSLRFTGTLTAERYAELSPRVSGLVSRVLVDAGDAVAEGEVLLALDSTLVALELKRAEAALDEALTRLEEAQRLRGEAERLGANIPQTTLRARAAQVAMEESALARLDAERRAQAELVARHTVVAPFDGVVAAKRAEVGEWVETGTPVFEFFTTDRLRLDVQVPQEHFARIGADTTVTVTLDALPGEAFAGRVQAKVPLSDADARTFLVRVVLDRPDAEIIAGMSAWAAFALGGGGSALALPRDALTRYPDGTLSVWVVEGEAGAGKAFERRVRIAGVIAETVEVIDGLDAGARVIVRGNETLQEGQAVRIVDETAMR